MGEPLAIQAPFIMGICAPTGTGKTFQARKFLDKLKTGEIPLVSRFNTKDMKQGDPYQLDKVHYVGVMADNSFDEMHNENITGIINAGAKPGVAKTIDELGAEQALTQEEKFGLLKPRKAADMVPDYVKNLATKHTCTVLDDMSAFLTDLSPHSKTTLKTLFQAGSHHKGVSLIFIYQNVPPDDLGGQLFKSSHYVMFPIPQYCSDTSLGIQVGEFRKIMHMNAGFSKDLLADYQALIKEAASKQQQVPGGGRRSASKKGGASIERAQFILYNKQDLMTDRQLAGLDPIAKKKHESESESSDSDDLSVIKK